MWAGFSLRSVLINNNPASRGKEYFYTFNADKRFSSGIINLSFVLQRNISGCRFTQCRSLTSANGKKLQRFATKRNKMMYTMLDFRKQHDKILKTEKKSHVNK